VLAEALCVLCLGGVLDFCFAVLALFRGVVVSAGNWTGNIHTSMPRSSSLVKVFLFQCFNFRFLSPLRQAIRKEQGGKRVRAAASCNKQQHVLPGFQGRLYAVEVLC